ncbi:reverse transcriptase domain-containing protein [Microvirga massiliensis]|uniref:reverse transcriptase domain-containing protein n=1 Tax=Microvirga massiliensis TaxID=1033741 RepID=UPI00062BA956|nr:reverse transcriptase domain-containing protein [Microvirga massiliensis]
MAEFDLRRLESIARLNANPTWVNRDLYRLLFKEDLYLAAYERIKSKPGNMTKGVDGTTLDGMNMPHVEAVIEAMRSESFTFAPARRTYIPKKNGKLRPLGIANPREKLVQEAIRMILEAIYDSPFGPTFSDKSYGFRQKRGTHNALREIRTRWTGVRWIIEGDIMSFFDNIEHDRLIELLRKRIKDERFLNLIRKALNAGVLDQGDFTATTSGTPQGSVVSPILANVYLHELDIKVTEIVARETKGKGAKPNPAYRSLVNKLYAGRKKGTITAEEVKAIQKAMRELSPYAQDDPDFIRVHYVRYADDWVIGIIGSRELAERTRSEIAEWLKRELRLELNIGKTHIRHAATEEAFFLGTRLSCAGRRNDSLVKHAPKPGYKAVKCRLPAGTVHLKAPINDIVAKLHQNGFCTKEGHPLSKRAWAVLDDDQIISRFNAVLDGILNYYSFTDNFARMRRVQYILQFSAAKTLSHRHRMKSIRRAFAKYGYNLTTRLRNKDGEERVVSMRLRKSFEGTPFNFKGLSNPGAGTEIRALKFGIRTKSSLLKDCAICGATDGVEMHHVRHIRKMGQEVKGFTRIMAAINRKQIPTCKKCHTDIHAGRYDGISLTEVALRMA